MLICALAVVLLFPRLPIGGVLYCSLDSLHALHCSLVSFRATCEERFSCDALFIETFLLSPWTYLNAIHDAGVKATKFANESTAQVPLHVQFDYQQSFRSNNLSWSS
jgi:hypothetical protein